jgi:hypothetical protein
MSKLRKTRTSDCIRITIGFKYPVIPCEAPGQAIQAIRQTTSDTPLWINSTMGWAHWLGSRSAALEGICADLCKRRGIQSCTQFPLSS